MRYHSLGRMPQSGSSSPCWRLRETTTTDRLLPCCTTPTGDFRIAAVCKRREALRAGIVCFFPSCAVVNVMVLVYANGQSGSRATYFTWSTYQPAHVWHRLLVDSTRSYNRRIVPRQTKRGYAAKTVWRTFWEFRLFDPVCKVHS